MLQIGDGVRVESGHAREVSANRTPSEPLSDAIFQGMQSPPAGPSPVTVARLAGSGLLLCFIGLTAIRPGFFVGFHPPTGNWVFAVLAAVPVACVAWVVATRVSASWGVVAALVLFTSPMGLALSMTTHGHLGSRALLALLFALLVHAEAKPTLRLGLLAGVVLGLAAWTRLFEAAFLTVPFVVAESWRAVKEGGSRRQFVLGALVTSVVLVALFLLHAHVVTGGWMPPRMSAGAVAAPQADVSWWKRFGGNTSVNVLRLVVWFGGPLGAGLCLVGALVDRFTRLLALSVVSVLALGAFHDNTGIHAVGPIHYSECVVPLVGARGGAAARRGRDAPHRVGGGESHVLLDSRVGDARVGAHSGRTLRGARGRGARRGAARRGARARVQRGVEAQRGVREAGHVGVRVATATA
jgi:hypothetical protein